MINYISLARRLKGKSLGASEVFGVANAFMPTVYQFNVPGGRPYQDDHVIFKKHRRMDHSYRFPMPAYKIEGNYDPEWTPYQDGYPLAPHTAIRIMPYFDGVNTIHIPHILTMHPVPKPGKHAVIGCLIDGEIVPCYETWSTNVFTWGPWKGKYLYHNRGLKPDVNPKIGFHGVNGQVGDYMWNWPELSGPMLKEAK